MRGCTPISMISRSEDEVVLGLDAGTTSAKGVAVDRTGRVRAEAGSDPIATRTTPDGGSEQNPEEIWRALTAVTRGVVEGLGPDDRVAALALAAQSGSVIPIPIEGRAEQAVTWMDTRSRSLVESWPPQVADRIRALSGWTPAAGAGLSTIAWMQGAGSEGDATPRVAPGARHASPDAGSGPAAERDPAAVDRWASVDDYLVFRLTGKWATNPSNASGMQLMEVSTRTWSPELCRVASVDPSALSLDTGVRHRRRVGLTDEAAVCSGTGCRTPRWWWAATTRPVRRSGLGVVDPGDLFLSAGTAWVLTVVTDSADVGALPPALNLSPHVVPGLWTASQSLGGLGAMLAETSPGDATAAFESCAASVRQALEDAGDMAAGDGDLILVGGGTRFSELVEVIASTVGRPVDTRPEATWPALGAARLAAAALGWTPLGGVL